LAPQDPTPIWAYFEDLEDPRVERTKLHSLQNIILLTLVATLAGADNWVEIAEYGEENEDWLKDFLDLPNGVPSHDTLGRVFRMLDATELSTRLAAWTTAVQERVPGEQVCIDGKSLRRAIDKAEGKAPLHIVNAWATGSRVVLGQVAVDAKENEIVAIPRLLGLIDVEGAVVSIDAMGCQTKIAQAVVDGGGDYLLMVKDNQPRMAAEMRGFFLDAAPGEDSSSEWTFNSYTDADHGRIETRKTWATSALDWFADLRKWASLCTLVVQSCERIVGDKTSHDVRYYITSLPADDPERLAGIIRNHWAIENELHWVLDMVFHEDQSRARRDNSAANLSAFRKLALALLKRETSKGSMTVKRKRCGWNPGYLLKVLLEP